MTYTALLKRFTAYGLALLMLVTTTGISINTLYCYCKKEFSVSFFDIKDGCSKSGTSSPKKCCSQKAKLANQNHGCTQHISKMPCTERNTEFLKLQSEFLSPEKKIQPQDFIATTVPTSIPFFTPYISNNSTSSILHHPPPRPSGVEKLKWIQSFLC